MSSSAQIANRQSSGDENTEEERVAYSSTVHRLIIFINGGAIGLLQVVTNSSTNEAERRAKILCFWLFTLIYTILRVFEVKLRNKPNIRNFAGNVSHLFGAIAALMIISLISPRFTLIVIALWLVWFFVVMYVSFSDLVFPKDNAVDPPD
ncbi:hypothetical protein EUTSA_v10010009mg [Eutrema salsugineum]|uniref:Uncharacterized protein n=1 Tax=Eutrema salsugineum TaxID=72664 RepID=V4KUB3_EUTSA|nr:uncharacterized protein LOC18991868 [Eutrema salsugineum]ESQ33617.1 hypothetical protein EUTSA_v10010009mg [Eutrema salsugineum]